MDQKTAKRLIRLLEKQEMRGSLCPDRSCTVCRQQREVRALLPILRLEVR